MNNRYEIEIKHPLLRPGLTIKTEASEKYVEKVVLKLMEIIRTINSNERSEKQENEMIKY